MHTCKRHVHIHTHTVHIHVHCIHAYLLTCGLGLDLLAASLLAA